MNIALINGINIHYKVEGPDTGFPVVFSNSLGTDFRIWDSLLPLLPKNLRFIRYDKRGHGLSDAPDAPYFMGDLVQDAAGLLDHLDVKNCVFIGLSNGGMIAQGLAAERPDLVSALVLSGTAAKVGNESMWQDRIDAVRKSGLETLAAPILERWFGKDFHKNKSEELAGWGNMLCRTPVEGYTGCCAAIAETDLFESTARLTLPTLGLVGSDDGATPPDLVRETVELIPNSRFKIIPKAGHLPCIEHPEVMAKHITNFMTENGLV